LPAMNCALTAPAQIIAVAIAGCALNNAIWTYTLAPSFRSGRPCLSTVGGALERAEGRSTTGPGGPGAGPAGAKIVLNAERA
jgi:hypothetical protein